MDCYRLNFLLLSGNLNGVATIFTSNIFENVVKRNATQKDILLVARIVTIIAGIGMILFAYWVPILGGAVNAYLTIIAIMDMPLFIIAVVYGLLWKKINWKGAIVGYSLGAISGVVGQFILEYDFNTTTFITAGVTLLFTPIVSLSLKDNKYNSKLESIWNARKTSEEEIQRKDIYNMIPKTKRGKLSLVIFFSGLAIFLIGVVLGSTGASIASYIAVSGMAIYFFGGLLRPYSD